MSELYTHSVIRGCIASKDIKKGTLILSSTVADCRGQGSSSSLYPNRSSYNRAVPLSEAQNHFRSILASFNQMKKACQNEYLKLPNRYKDTKCMPESAKDLKYYESILRSLDQDFDTKNLEIIAIYATNISQVPCFNGVDIKIAQFHHSCNPNAVILLRKPVSELRSIRKIKTGDEITINRLGSANLLLGLNTRKFRLKILYEVEYFICSCEICEGIEDIQDVANTVLRMKSSLEEKFGDEIAKLAKEEDYFMTIMTTVDCWRDKIRKTGAKLDDLISDRSLIKEHKECYNENSEKCKEYLKTVHKLFKLGKEIDAPPICLYILVRNGYWAASTIFLFTDHMHQRMFFYKEAINFAKTAEKFAKVLGKEVVEPEKWQKRQIHVEAIEVMLG